MTGFLVHHSAASQVAAIGLLALAAAGVAYLALAAAALARLRARGERAYLASRAEGGPASGRAPPAVSLLVPLAGGDPAFPASADAYLAQRYEGEWELLFCVLDPGDAAAIEAVKAALARAPAGAGPGPGEPRARLVLGDGRSPGPNRKVANLGWGIAAARFEVIAMADADMRPAEDFLGRLVAPLEGGVGAGGKGAGAGTGAGAGGGVRGGAALSTSLYRANEAQGLGGALEALAIDTDFVPSVAVAAAVEPLRFALGAAIALRRGTLEAIGGIAPLGEYIGEDYHLGRLVAEKVGPVALAPAVIPTHVGRMSLGAHVKHQLRWARTVRSQRPGGYVGLAVTNPLVFALGALAVAPALETAAVVGAVVLARVVTIVAVSRSLGAPGAAARALLAPLHDVVRAGIWLGGLLGGGVVWRGQTFRIGRDGRIIADGR